MNTTIEKPSNGLIEKSAGPVVTDLSPEEIDEANKARLQRNLKKHLGLIPGILRQYQVSELIAVGLIPKIQGFDDGSDKAHAGSPFTGPNVSGGVRGIAGYIFQNFAIRISHQSVHNWMQGTGLPPGCTENFPGPEGNGSNRWKRLEIDTWVIRYLKPNHANGIVHADNKSRSEKANADILEMERDALHQKTSGLYTLTEIHVRTTGAIEQVDRAATRATVEKEIPARFAEELKLFSERQASMLSPEIQIQIVGVLREICVKAYTGWQAYTGDRFSELIKLAKQDNEEEKLK